MGDTAPFVKVYLETCFHIDRGGRFMSSTREGFGLVGGVWPAFSRCVVALFSFGPTQQND